MLVLRIKTGSEEIYNLFTTKDKILVDHLIQYENMIKIGQPVLLIFGGDGTPWDKGLAAFCKVASAPIDLGYEIAKNGKYYKLELDVIIRLKRCLGKIDFARYPQTFDSGVGPSTKGERNQALGIIDESDNITIAAICRAVLDFEPDIEKELRLLLGDELINNSKINTKVYIDPDENKKSILDLITLRAREFKIYLQTIAKNSNGETLSDQSISNYVSALVQKPFINYLQENFNLGSLYLTEDVLLLDDIYTDLKTSSVDEDSHQTYSSALLRYKEFVIYNSSIVELKEPFILYGPPGTGKTFEMQQKYINKFAKDKCFVTTFHQSFSYEEFVEGMKPYIPEGTSTISYKIEPGIFYMACEKAVNFAGYATLSDCINDSKESRLSKMNQAVNEKKLVLLCIDEINRANVSAVFGDLISLVESSKRLGAKYEMTAKLPYSKKDFGVPLNLMIIGTMNTADRSIQLLDSALRRRFKFVELLPNYKVLSSKNTNDKALLLLKCINNRIRALLDKDHQVGHSYFIGKNTNMEILEVLKEKIIPLLEEYFYNEIEKVRQVFNETDNLVDAKTHINDYLYILDTEANNAIKNKTEFDDEKVFYKLNDKIEEVKTDTEAENFLKHIYSENETSGE